MTSKRFILRLNFGDMQLIDTKQEKILRVYPNALRNDLWHRSIEDCRLLNETEIIEVQTV